MTPSLNFRLEVEIGLVTKQRVLPGLRTFQHRETSSAAFARFRNSSNAEYTVPAVSSKTGLQQT
eukprot:1137243-Pelagomonas_calceolata.AAC.1